MEFLDIFWKLKRNYLFKLYEVHVGRNAKIESALTLKRIGDTLEFESRPFSEEWSRAVYPQAITEAEVKELLLAEAIDALEDAKLFKQAIQQCKLLETYYESLQNYEQISDLLRIRLVFNSFISISVKIGCFKVKRTFSYFENTIKIFNNYANKFFSNPNPVFIFLRWFLGNVVPFKCSQHFIYLSWWWTRTIRRLFFFFEGESV